MTADSLPLRLLLATLAGWVNRHQQQVVAGFCDRWRPSWRRIRSYAGTGGW